MIAALLLAAAAPSAVWSVDGQPGSVRTVTGKVRTGGRIVADGFISGSDAAAEEKSRMTADRGTPGSCASVARTRPFTRLRRYAADGRLLWVWNVQRDTEQALSLLAPAEGDCLSPDGGRLLVTSYNVSYDVASMLGAAVTAVDRNPRFVDAKGRHTGEMFGTKKLTAAQGWRKGSDATLVFSIFTENSERSDSVVLGRRP